MRSWSAWTFRQAAISPIRVPEQDQELQGTEAFSRMPQAARPTVLIALHPFEEGGIPHKRSPG